MTIKETIGIDMSKENFDVRIHSNQMYEAFENSIKGFKKLIKWVDKNSVFSKDESLFVFEHTGLYSHQLSVFLTEQNFNFVMIPGLEIRRSLGIARGKDDKVDATKIALYAFRLRDELKPTQLPTEEIMALKHLLSLRERLVKQRAGYKVSRGEQQRVLVKKENKVLFETQEKIISFLNKQIKAVEQELNEIITCSEDLKRNFNLITSIKGVGTQTALQILVCTNNFTKFKNARKFASYCGIAPFPNRSGTSLRGKTKVSPLANKRVKSLLDLCAKVAIQRNIEMKQYYKRKVSEGKNKMSVINIIRNKLLARVFAVVHRGSPYVNITKYAA
jgi:transposase